MTIPTAAAAPSASTGVDVYPDSAPFSTWMGIAVESVGNSRAALRLAPKPELMNRRGVFHGGVLATLLDSAMARASRAIENVATLAGTIDLNIKYMRPAEGELRAEAWVEHAANTLAFCRGEVRNAAGELVAAGTATMRLRRTGGGQGAASGGDADKVTTAAAVVVSRASEADLPGSEAT